MTTILQVGPRGEMGLVGPTGAVGPQGISGVAGPRGFAGIEGARGLQGLPANPNEPAMICDTLAAGVSVAVGLSNNIVLTGSTGTVFATKYTTSTVPTTDTELTNKLYVDTLVGGLAAPDLTGYATETYVTTAIGAIPATDLSALLPKSGGTMSGTINMNGSILTNLGAPTNPNDSIPKYYFDNNITAFLARSGGSMTGPVAMGNNKITGLGAPTVTTDAATKTYVDTSLTTLLSKAGGTMTGVIAMGNNKITGLGAPTATTDAATKNYVDSISSSSFANGSDYYYVNHANAGFVARTNTYNRDNIYFEHQSTTCTFRVTSNGAATNALNSWGSSSDIKLKENIVDATPKLASLNQLRIVNYNLITNPGEKLIGVVAQEAELIFPGLIDDNIDRDANGVDLGTTTKSVKYSILVPMLVKAMQEQTAIIAALTARVTALETP